MNYKNIYKENTFKVLTVTFNKDTLGQTVLNSKVFAIITAFNPDNSTLPLDQNLIRNKELLEDLKDYNYDEAIGYLGEHSEESFCIYDIDFNDAIELGRKYEQYSIFFNNSSDNGYYNVVTSEKIY